MLGTSENKSFQNGVQFAWDSTSLKNWDTCPRYYYYTNILGWKPKRENDHIRFGKHYATALEHYHKHLFEGADHDEATLRVVREAMIDSHGWQSLDNVKTRANLIRTIVWYLEQHKDDPLKVITLSDGRPAVEYSFSIAVDNDIFFCGHLDKIVDFEGHAYVQDQKTTKSTISPQYFRQYSPDIQMSMYSFAGQAIYKNPVKGVMIDAAQIAVGFTRFDRGFAFRPVGVLEEWYDMTMLKIEQAQTATREQHFPMRETSCHNFGGCAFREVCHRAPFIREKFLEAEFEKQPTWDPLERR